MRRLLALLCLPLSAVTLAACGSTATTAGFKGEKHEVAQTISNLQADATAAEQKKICANDLAAALVRRLDGSKGCEAAIKSQLAEVDNLEATVQSVQLAASGKTATAQVKSIHEGKAATSAVSLVKEGGKWKISGVG
ncbi:MAG: hypothetical protein ACLQBY_13460 [Solirubrobacteraceae bacterium]